MEEHTEVCKRVQQESWVTYGVTIKCQCCLWFPKLFKDVLLRGAVSSSTSMIDPGGGEADLDRYRQEDWEFKASLDN